jgi:hypothetical protein
MDEDLKQRILPALLVFNVVIIAYQLIFNYLSFSWLKFLLGAVIAGGCAGAAYFFAGRK